MDRFIGDVELRRGRCDPDEVRVGDVLGFWHVEAMEPDHLLRLCAEILRKRCLPNIAPLSLN